MRVTTWMAGVAVVLAACSGGEKGNEAGNDQAAAMDTTAAAAPAAAPATNGATHDVDMTMVNGQPRYQPETITAKPGDVIVFHNKEGGPHNVSFWQDSIPQGAASAITIPDNMGPLTSQLVVEQGGEIRVTLGANAPAGTYMFYCQPHLAQGMHGQLQVQQ